MYHTYYFFSRLSQKLNLILPGSRLVESFSQQKDELILQFYISQSESLYIKADLGQGLGLLSFPSQFARTRSNSVDLFPHLIEQVVAEVRQTRNDRSFHIVFQNGLQLCFKMYGGRSNVLVHDGNKVLDVLNKNLKKDLESPPPADKVLNQDFEKLLPDPELLRNQFPTFSKRMWAYWVEISHGKPHSEQKNLFRFFLETLKLGKMYLCRELDEVFLTFFPNGNIFLETDDAILVCNQFQQLYWQVNRFFKQKALISNQAEKNIFQIKSQLKFCQDQRILLEQSTSYKHQADLLMAFSHLVKKGASQVELLDFDGEGLIEIKLKKDLSVNENAERFYRKSKKENENERRLEDKILALQQNENALKLELDQIGKAEIWADLKPFAIAKKEIEESKEPLPYFQKIFMNYEIWIGKNAKSNDLLLRMGHKDDYWLHAKDVPGSHVIIRKKNGEKPPPLVQERAAELAAYFSKAKNQSLVPVMMTERKYVRKVKGMAAGMVRVEKEKTILIAPKE